MIVDNGQSQKRHNVAGNVNRVSIPLSGGYREWSSAEMLSKRIIAKY